MEAAEDGENQEARECPRFNDRGLRHRGSIDGGGVRAAVSRQRGSFQACYADFMLRVAVVVVRVDVRFVVNRDGSIGELDVCPSVEDPALEACVEEIFRSIEFPRPEGGPAWVFYPIDLSP